MGRSLSLQLPSAVLEQKTVTANARGREREVHLSSSGGWGGCWSLLSLGLGSRCSGGCLLGGLLLLGGIGGRGLSLVAVGRCPEGEVVAEELHDEGAVPVRLLRQRVELSDGVVERLLGKVACTVGRVQDLVVEDREVQCKTQTNGVGRCELGLGDVGSRLFWWGQLFGVAV